MPAPRQEIAQIDRQINANRLSLNDRAVERELFRQRGFAQLRRDEACDAERRKAARRALPKVRCPTCGHVSFASA